MNELNAGLWFRIIEGGDEPEYEMVKRYFESEENRGTELPQMSVCIAKMRNNRSHEFSQKCNYLEAFGRYYQSRWQETIIDDLIAVDNENDKIIILEACRINNGGFESVPPKDKSVIDKVILQILSGTDINKMLASFIYMIVNDYWKLDIKDPSKKFCRGLSDDEILNLKSGDDMIVRWFEDTKDFRFGICPSDYKEYMDQKEQAKEGIEGGNILLKNYLLIIGAGGSGKSRFIYNVGKDCEIIHEIDGSKFSLAKNRTFKRFIDQVDGYFRDPENKHTSIPSYEDTLDTKDYCILENYATIDPNVNAIVEYGGSDDTQKWSQDNPELIKRARGILFLIDCETLDNPEVMRDQMSWFNTNFLTGFFKGMQIKHLTMGIVFTKAKHILPDFNFAEERCRLIPDNFNPSLIHLKTSDSQSHIQKLREKYLNLKELIGYDRKNNQSHRLQEFIETLFKYGEEFIMQILNHTFDYQIFIIENEKNAKSVVKWFMDANARKYKKESWYFLKNEIEKSNEDIYELKTFRIDLEKIQKRSKRFFLLRIIGKGKASGLEYVYRKLFVPDKLRKKIEESGLSEIVDIIGLVDKETSAAAEKIVELNEKLASLSGMIENDGDNEDYIDIDFKNYLNKGKNHFKAEWTDFEKSSVKFRYVDYLLILLTIILIMLIYVTFE